MGFLEWLSRSVLGTGIQLPDSVAVVEVKDKADVKAAFAASNDNPVLIYKHSTRCGGSAMALGEIHEYLCKSASTPRLYVVNVLTARDASNTIADRTGIVHQSPQLILLKDGKVVWDASHAAIRESAIVSAVASHG